MGGGGNGDAFGNGGGEGGGGEEERMIKGYWRCRKLRLVIRTRKRALTLDYRKILICRATGYRSLRYRQPFQNCNLLGL